MHYYPHNIPDFNNGTRHLTRVERSVYRDAIEMYYDTESPLPSDDFDRLARLLLCRSEEEKGALQLVLDDFFELRDGAYHHERCDSEIEKYRSSIEAKAKAGKASANARRRKKEEQNETLDGTDDEQNSTDDEQALNGCSTDEQLTKNQELRSNSITDSNESVVGAGAPPPCPHREIIFLYNEALPELQHVIPDRWGGARQKALQARWRESRKHQSLDFWRSFFTELRNYPWYMGENDRGWRADLGWIVKRENFDKLIEKFTSGRRAA